MTYDLDAVAAAVRAVAPEAKVWDSERMIKILPSWERPKLLEASRDGYISTNFVRPQDRAIVRAVLDELDRQDGEHAGFLHATSAAPEAT